MVALVLVMLGIGITVSTAFWALYGLGYVILMGISKILYG